ncbi:hypothetical protein B296_00058187 [Ensete ventricosum]|uniref:Uncharacterized protein n=1 Tax=Ensete ventricosum TaxID=4639 RepID=A0A426XDB9_ENSVE|nr:hypothetical protein B296_00058187 [Ensete ventricosum]
MRLRLQCVELDKKPEELKIDPIDLEFYNEYSELISEWIEATENQEDPLLDGEGDPQHPSRFITEAIKEEDEHPQQVKNPSRSERGGKEKEEGSRINHSVIKNRVRRRNTFTIEFSNSLGPET